MFEFNDLVNAFSLALAVADPITPGYSGYDLLVFGSDSDQTLTKSTETCQNSQVACGGLSYPDGRAVTAGTLYTPEPAKFILLGVGGGVLAMIRPRRVTRAVLDVALLLDCFFGVSGLRGAKPGLEDRP